MKTKFVRAAFVAALLSTTAMIATTPASAAEKVSAAAAKPLIEAQKDLTAKDFKGALAALQQAQALPNLTPFDTYTINKFLAVVDANLKDIAGATTAAEAAADSPSLADDDADKKNVLNDALEVAGNAQHWQKVLTYASQLQAMNALDEEDAGIVAIAYFNLKDTANAKKYAQMSVDMSKAAGKQPDENAMRILSAQTTTDLASIESSSEQMAANYNHPEDWNRAVMASIGANDTKPLTNADALNMLRMLVLQHALQTADDYTLMVGLAEGQRYAYEATKIADAGIAAGTVTAAQLKDSLGKARSEAAADEKIIDQAISAASKSKKGEDSMQIAQDLWGYGRYADVESIATAAKAKGGIKDPGEADVLIGMAQIAQGKYDAGIATLAKVSGGAGRKRTAHLWTLYAQTVQKTGSAAH